MEDVKVVIVTRHKGLVEWLKRRGVEGSVIAQASPEDVTGKQVIGAVPLYLAALAESVVSIDMPDLTPEQRGKDLSPEEMDGAGATMTEYVVVKV